MPERRRKLSRSLGAPFAILLVGASVAVFLYFDKNRSNHDSIVAALEVRAQEISDAVVDNVGLYQYGLRGYRGAVLTKGLDDFNYSDELTYVESRKHEIEFPGARGFGLIRRVRPEDVDAFLAASVLDHGGGVRHSATE